MINIIFGFVLLAIIGFFVWKYILNKPQTTKLTEQPKKENNKTLPKKEVESFLPFIFWIEANFFNSTNVGILF